MDSTSQNIKRIYEKYFVILSSRILPVDKGTINQQELKVEEILILLENLPDFINEYSTNISKGQIISSLTELIVGFGLVDRVASEYEDFEPKDFPDVAENAVKCFECLKMLLNEINNLDRSQKQQFLIHALLLCGTHFKSNPWNTNDSITECEAFQKNLLSSMQYKTLSTLLVDDSFHPTIFKRVLKKMRPNLMKDSWQFYPSSCYIFHFLLTHVKHPFLEDYLSDVLPPAFMFSSYFKTPQKVIGIQCFFHILDNVPQSLIQLDGREDAIYHSLFPLIYSKEHSIIECLYPCLLKMSKMRPQKTQSVVWEDYDKVFNQILFTIAMEFNVTMRRLLLTQVYAFCDHAPPFKHLKRIIDVVKDTITNEILQDTVCTVTALKILKCIIKSCWYRMKNHCFEILVFILELQENKVNLKNSSADLEEDVKNLSEECIILLKLSCDETFKAITQGFLEDVPDLPQAKFLKNVLIENV